MKIKNKIIYVFIGILIIELIPHSKSSTLLHTINDFNDATRWTVTTAVFDNDATSPTFDTTGATSGTQLFIEEGAGGNSSADDGVTLVVSFVGTTLYTLTDWYADVRLQFTMDNVDGDLEYFNNYAQGVKRDGFNIVSTDGNGISFDATNPNPANELDPDLKAALDTDQTWTHQSAINPIYSDQTPGTSHVMDLSFGDMFAGDTITNLTITMQVDSRTDDFELSNFTIYGVPEPSASILIILGFLFFILRRNKIKN